MTGRSLSILVAEKNQIHYPPAVDRARMHDMLRTAQPSSRTCDYYWVASRSATSTSRPQDNIKYVRKLADLKLNEYKEFNPDGGVRSPNASVLDIRSIVSNGLHNESWYTTRLVALTRRLSTYLLIYLAKWRTQMRSVICVES